MIYIIQTLLSTIFNTLFNACKLVFMVYVLQEVMPKLIENPKINKIMVSSIHNSIYYYSMLQIKICKLQKYMEPFTDHVLNKSKELISFYEELYKRSLETNIVPPLTSNYTEAQLYKSGRINTLSYKYDNNDANNGRFDNIINLIEDLGKDEYDNIIFSVKHELNNECLSKLYYREIPTIVKVKESQIKFFMMKIKYFSEEVDTSVNDFDESITPLFEHVIELKNDKYNFYMVGNTFDNNFFKYYLINMCGVDSLKLTNKYIVDILDHNVLKHKMNESERLVIQDDSYYTLGGVLEPSQLEEEFEEITNEESSNNVE